MGRPGYGDQYITNPVPEGSSPANELTHVWHAGTRGPEHARNWRVKIEREFPELFHAIQRITGGETGWKPPHVHKLHLVRTEIDPHPHYVCVASDCDASPADLNQAENH